MTEFVYLYLTDANAFVRGTVMIFAGVCLWRVGCFIAECVRNEDTSNDDLPTAY